MTSICAGGWSVDASAGPAGATLQALEQARQKMGLPDTEDTGVRPPSADDDGEERSATGRIAARCWALLLVRIYECLSLVCTRCGAPMWIIAFILDPPVVERILTHIGEAITPPAVRLARTPPQGEFGFAQVDPTGGPAMWPEIDQTGGRGTWDSEPAGQHRDLPSCAAETETGTDADGPVCLLGNGTSWLKCLPHLPPERNLLICICLRNVQQIQYSIFNFTQNIVILGP